MQESQEPVPIKLVPEGAYVNLDYGICLTAPERWETIPSPKEANPEFRVQNEIKSLVRFKRQEPDQATASDNGWIC